jgi:dipeptidyl aminopeptidase/acylaminoacyl peptidase
MPKDVRGILKRMAYRWPLLFFAALTATAACAQSKSFTLQQALSAPYATDLTAAPAGNLFAWVEDEEGRHNLFVGGKDIPARALTHNTEDDAQDISQIAWSPDAKSIAFTYGAPAGADGRPANPAHLQHPTPLRVMLVGVSRNATTITIGEGRAPLFTRDGKGLLFIRDGQVWMTCLEDCHTEKGSSAALLARQLVFDRGSASSLTLSPDGQTLAFISRRREYNAPSHTLLALYSFATHALSFPAPSTGDDSAPAFSPDGKELAWIRNPFTEIPEFANPRASAMPWSIQLLSVADGKARTLYSPEANKPGSVLPDPAGHDPYLLWAADHRIVFYGTADGWVHLYALETAPSAQPRLLTPGNFEVEDAMVDRARDLLVYASNDAVDANPGAGVTSAVIDPAGSDRRRLEELSLSAKNSSPGKITTTSSIATHPAFSIDGTLAALVGDTQHPMHPAVLGRGGRFTSLGSEGKDFSPASFIAPQPVQFDAVDGVHLHGQLFLPTQKAKRPALIFVHGGPMRQMLLGFPPMDYYSNAYAMNQYLTSKGFIVLSVNYRCGIGYGLEFHQCQNAGADGATEYNDVLAAQKYLASRDDVDVKRIGIWGGSYGGYLTALALARNSDLFAAGVDFHGVHDWNLEDNASDWKRGSFAQQDAIAAKALKSSPLADLSKWSSPILLIHGDNDPSVAYAQTPLLADALRARNASLAKDHQVEVNELIFPDEVHEFALHKDWLAAYEATAAFFERTLKP